MFCSCGAIATLTKIEQCNKCYKKSWHQKNKIRILEQSKAKFLAPPSDTEELCIKCNGRFPFAHKMCKSCYEKDKYQKNRNSILERARTPKDRFIRARSKAKEKGMVFSLSEVQYTDLINLPCNYCNGYFPATVAGIGLDRLDNSKGYEFGNVVSACGTCNQIRMDVFSPEETKIMVQTVINYRQSEIKS